MAIDTAAKRRQMLGMTEETLPIPDGTISAVDRALLLQIYYLVASALTSFKYGTVRGPGASGTVRG